jgi:tetratricopeptide (TPR) repeat protein
LLKLIKKDAGTPLSGAELALLGRVAEKSILQADELEKKGRLNKKIAGKYLELAWLRSTIQANLQSFKQPGQTTVVNTLPQFGSFVTASEQELGDYQNALHYLLLSLDTFATDETLFFNAGLCSAHIGKYQQQQSDTPASLLWYKKARQYYNRALELDENYIEALYSLAILLVYELHEPQQAVTYLVRIKERERYNTDARFLLAYTYYILGEYKQAIQEYEELEKLVKTSELRAQAGKNKQQILKQLNH